VSGGDSKKSHSHVCDRLLVPLMDFGLKRARLGLAVLCSGAALAAALLLVRL
jgi:hypothetical protein